VLRNGGDVLVQHEFKAVVICMNDRPPKDKVTNGRQPGQDQLILVHKLPIWCDEKLWADYKKRLTHLEASQSTMKNLSKSGN
jgi:hypothetical protein